MEKNKKTIMSKQMIDTAPETDARKWHEEQVKMGHKLIFSSPNDLHSTVSTHFEGTSLLKICCCFFNKKKTPK